jgi:hypothetical protein
MPLCLLHDLAPALGWSLIEGNETHAAFAAWALEIGPSLSRHAALKLAPSSRTFLFVPSGVTDVLRKDPRWSLGAGRRVSGPMLAFARLCESLSVRHGTDLFAIVEDRLGVGAGHGTRPLRVEDENYRLWSSEEGPRSLRDVLREYSSQPSFGVHLGVSHEMRCR